MNLINRKEQIHHYQDLMCTLLYQLSVKRNLERSNKLHFLTTTHKMVQKMSKIKKKKKCIPKIKIKKTLVQWWVKRYRMLQFLIRFLPLMKQAPTTAIWLLIAKQKLTKHLYREKNILHLQRLSISLKHQMSSKIRLSTKKNISQMNQMVVDKRLHMLHQTIT